VKKSSTTVRASKDNARKAKKLVARLIAGKQITEGETWFLNEFMDRAIGRLPTDDAINADRERNKIAAAKKVGKKAVKKAAKTAK